MIQSEVHNAMEKNPRLGL